MMVSLDQLMLKYRLEIRGVLHVGAHLAEEAADYAKHGIHPVWWIEANADLIPRIEQEIGQYRRQQVIQALVYDTDGVDLGFNITNMDGMSSSILEWGTHPKHAPQCKFVDRRTLLTSTVDSLAETHGISANFLNMDLQGAEMHALKGAEKFIAGVDYVFTEVNVNELYKGCARLWEMDAWLAERGFIRLELCMAENHVYWGDALYVRDTWR